MSLVERGKERLDTPNPRFDFAKFAWATSKAIRGTPAAGAALSGAATAIVGFAASPALVPAVGAAIAVGGAVGVGAAIAKAYLDYRKGARARWAAGRGAATGTKLRTATAVGLDTGKLAAQGLRAGKSQAECAEIADGVKRWQNGQPPSLSPLGKQAWGLMHNWESERQYAVADGFAKEVLTPSSTGAGGVGAPAAAGSAGRGGAGVSALRQALQSLMLQTQPVIVSLSTSQGVAEDLRDQFLHELEASSSGRDVLDAVGGAAAAVEEASNYLASATSATAAYIEGLER